MALVFLTLGGMLLHGMELPEQLKWGGEQTLHVHKVSGGIRVIDAMGREDAEISWQGRFRGWSAVDRARRLDAKRIAGAPLLLTWDRFVYRVIIKSFTADYSQAGLEIPYHIGLVVVQDLTRPASPSGGGLLTSLLQDLDALQDIMLLMSNTSLIGAITSVLNGMDGWQQAAAGLDSPFSSLGALGALGDVLNEAQSTASSALSSLAADFPGGSLLQGVTASDMASSLSGAAAAFPAMASVVSSAGLLGRMGRNVSLLRGTL